MNSKICEKRNKKVEKTLIAMEAMHLRDTEFVHALTSRDGFGLV